MRRKKRRIKKRFYFISAFFIVIMLLSLMKILQFILPDGVNLPEVKKEDTAFNIAGNGNPKICLDAGHGGHDNGSTSILGFFEKDINLEIVLKVGKLLEKDGYEVIYIRTDDEAKGDNQEEDLKERCRISNDAGADIFVSIHCNFDKRRNDSKGLEVWCRFPGQKGEDLAKCMDSRLTEAVYTRDRGIKYENDAGLYVLKNTKAVAALVEVGFLSNKEDSSFLKSDEGKEKCSNAIAQGIEDFAQKQ